MSTEKTKKNENIFECMNCDFNTSKKTDYTRHLQTHKHKINIQQQNSNAKNEKKYICEFCERIYNDRSGLWRHKKGCYKKETNNEITDKNEISDKELIITLIKQNSELIEVVKTGTHNTSNSHNNSHNKTFNLQFFLNETCKDAMNIMEFVDSIKLQLTDLENVGKIGYVNGISDIIIQNLNNLDITQRPVHCTDKKREVLYVKDENKWEKEDEEKKNIRKVIKRIADKNIRLIPQFKEKHPDCLKSHSKYTDQYNKIIIESMGGPGDNDEEKEDKIIKNIAKIITINKE
jgi:hypothetical protein